MYRSALQVCRFSLMFLVFAGLLSTYAIAQDYPTAPGNSGDQPTYPGIPPAGKVESSLGEYSLRVYGTVLLNGSFSDTSIVGGEVPLWPTPSSGRTSFLDGTSKRSDDIHDIIFTARQSVFGFMLTPGDSGGGDWKSSAKLEFDLFGTRPVDNNLSQGRVFNQPRLRFAYFQFGKDNFKITAGQDKAILAPLDPVSLSHVAVPLGASAGNLWGWLPQVRMDLTHKLGRASALFQAGVLRPQFADPRLGDQPTAGTSLEGSPGLGERASQPFYQSRVALTFPMTGSNATVGASGHYGRERIGADRTLDSWAFAIDYSVPLMRRLRWRGENFVGSNLVPFQGGIIQGVAFVQPIATAPPTQINRIGAGGGWTELIVDATSRNIFYLGVGADDPRDRDLLPGSTRSRNEFAWISYFRKVSDQITTAFEWSNWQFKTRGVAGGVIGPQGPSGTANVFNVSLAFQF